MEAAERKVGKEGSGTRRKRTYRQRENGGCQFFEATSRLSLPGALALGGRGKQRGRASGFDLIEETDSRRRQKGSQSATEASLPALPRRTRCTSVSPALSVARLSLLEERVEAVASKPEEGRTAVLLVQSGGGRAGVWSMLVLDSLASPTGEMRCRKLRRRERSQVGLPPLACYLRFRQYSL